MCSNKSWKYSIASRVMFGINKCDFQHFVVFLGLLLAATFASIWVYGWGLGVIIPIQMKRKQLTIPTMINTSKRVIWTLCMFNHSSYYDFVLLVSCKHLCVLSLCILICFFFLYPLFLSLCFPSLSSSLPLSSWFSSSVTPAVNVVHFLTCYVCHCVCVCVCVWTSK